MPLFTFYLRTHVCLRKESSKLYEFTSKVKELFKLSDLFLAMLMRKTFATKTSRALVLLLLSFFEA